MDIQQSNIPKIVDYKFPPDIKNWIDKIQKMLVEYEYSLLQLKVDGRKESELGLKIIAIDKILKLNFPNDYIAFFSEAKEILTDTEEEIFEKWLENKSYQLEDSKFLVKNTFYRNTNHLYKLTFSGKEFYLLLRQKEFINMIYSFIEKAFSK